MANVLVNDASLTAIANAIRAKTNNTDTYTPAEMAEAINAIEIKNSNDDVSYQQWNDSVKNYINNVTYDPSDYTISSIDAYVTPQTSYSKNKPLGVLVTLPDGILVMTDQGTGQSYADAVKAGDKIIYNVSPLGGTYAVLDDKSVKQSGHLSPTGQVRMIEASTVNMRDLGGWKCDGGTVKYGKIYRGGAINPDDTDLFLKKLGIRHELDLRGIAESGGITESSLGSSVRYDCPAKSIYYTINGFDSTWKEILSCIFDAIIHNEPLYLHCSAGADRTGTVACVIEALLGVSQSDCDKDYELTCFNTGVATDTAARRRNESDWKQMIASITSQTIGTTFRNKVINWVGSLGFTADDINAFRKSMIDGAPEAVTIVQIAYSIKSNLTNCTINNSVTSVKKGASYSATITANDGYTLGVVTVTMGGTDITSSAVSGGKITVSSVTGNVTITASATAQPYTYTVSDLAVAIRSNWEFQQTGNVPTLANANTQAALGVTTANASGARTDRESKTIYVMPIPAKATKVTITDDGSSISARYRLLNYDGYSWSLVKDSGSFINALSYEFAKGSAGYILIALNHTDNSSWTWGYNDSKIAVKFTNY